MDNYRVFSSQHHVRLISLDTADITFKTLLGRDAPALGGGLGCSPGLRT